MLSWGRQVFFWRHQASFLTSCALRRGRLCFQEQKHAVLAPLWKICPQKMPVIRSSWTSLQVIFSWVWFYFQINRSWEALLPSCKPELFSDYLGFICLGVGDRCEGVCWQLQGADPGGVPECWGEEHCSICGGAAGGVPGDMRGKRRLAQPCCFAQALLLCSSNVDSFLISWNVLFLHKDSFYLLVSHGIHCCCLQDDFSAFCLICSFRWAWNLS